MYGRSISFASSSIIIPLIPLFLFIKQFTTAASFFSFGLLLAGSLFRLLIPLLLIPSLFYFRP